jgi:hypothetical protein
VIVERQITKYFAAISWRDYKRWDYDVHIVSYIMARLQTMRLWCSHCQLYHGKITNDKIMMFTLSAISWRDYKRWDYDVHIVSYIMARLQTMRLWCSHCQLYHGEITNDEIMMFTLSAISWRDYKRWDYDVHIVVDQHSGLDFYSSSSLKQQSVCRHVAPLWHIILIQS